MVKKYFLMALVLLIAVVVFWQSGVFEKNITEPTPTETPLAEPSNSFIPLPTGVLQGFWGPTGLREPASCTLSGKINFIQKNIYESDKALFTYKNVDDDTRNVRWVVSPADNLIIGPNLFSGLDIPNGQSTLTIALPEPQKYRFYTLTAFLNYGQIVERGSERNVEVKEVKCKGSIPVKLSF